MTLFTCMYRWLEEKKKLMVELGEENIELHLDHFITELLPKIRFPMMTPAQLADLLLNPLSQTHTELLVERIRMAMCYHKNQLDISEKGRVSMRCSGIKGTKNLIIVPKVLVYDIIIFIGIYFTQLWCPSKNMSQRKQDIHSTFIHR